MESDGNSSENILYLQVPLTEQQCDSRVVWSEGVADESGQSSQNLTETLYETGRMIKLSGNVLPVRIGALTVNALLDTGAASCFISDNFWEKIQVVFPKIKSRQVADNLIFLDANSNEIKLKEVVEFDMEIRDCYLPVQCYISPKLPVPLVLGWDWMRENDVVIMPNCETVTVYGQPVLSILEGLTDPQQLSLQLSRSVEIPPTSMVQCQVCPGFQM